MCRAWRAWLAVPELWQEPDESNEAFKVRVMAVACQLRKQNEQIA